MADNFIFEIGGNIDAFKKTISEVEAELKRVRGTLKNQLGQGLVDANKNIAQLEQSLVNLKQVGLDKLPKAANNGSSALFSLSQVARDAPFGFIAIQNNLPLVVDQFTQLSKTSGGLGGALKSVGAALIGPAGLSFAFGAAIAGITALVQKYGSLGEAFNQILGITPKVTEAQKAFNEAIFSTSGSLVDENAKLNILIKTLNDTKKPLSERLAAYNEIKNVFPDVIAGIRDENALSKESLDIINKQAQAKKDLLKLKITEAGISAALQKNEQKLAELTYQRTIAKTEEDVVQKKLNKSTKDQNIFARGAEQGINTYSITLSKAKGKVKELDDQINLLTAEQKGYLDQLDPIINGIAQINYNTDKRVIGLKNELKAEKEANKQRKESLETTKELIEFAVPMAAPSAGVQFDNYLKRLREQADIQKRLKQEQLDLENQKVTRGFLQDTIAGFKDIQGPRIENVIFDVNRMQKISSEYQKLVQQRFENIAGIVQDTLTQPLTYLFDTVLEGGKISWKELGNIVVEQLKRIAIQITTTAAAVAIADLLTKGGYSASVKLFNKATGIVDRGGTGVSVGRPSAVNFGGIQGGIGLSGQVVFVQRGTDLVGVLNRSNATINRVG